MDDKVSEKLLPTKESLVSTDMIRALDYSDPENPRSVKVPASSIDITGTIDTIFRGPWETDIEYAVNDCVQKDGNAYACMTAHTSGNFETDLAAEKWQLYAAKGENGATYNWTGSWVTSHEYAVNDCFSMNGNGYVVLVAHTSGVFLTDLAAEKISLFVSKGERGEPGLTGPAGPAGPAGPTGAAGIYAWKGEWITGFPYAESDCMTKIGNGYVCVVPHTSGDFEADLNAGKWQLFVQRGPQGEQGIQGPASLSADIIYGTSTTPPDGQVDGTIYVTYIP